VDTRSCIGHTVIVGLAGSGTLMGA
jgi:hypothetical protein